MGGTGRIERNDLSEAFEMKKKPLNLICGPNEIIRSEVTSNSSWIPVDQKVLNWNLECKLWMLCESTCLQILHLDQPITRLSLIKSSKTFLVESLSNGFAKTNLFGKTNLESPKFAAWKGSDHPILQTASRVSGWRKGFQKLKVRKLKLKWIHLKKVVIDRKLCKTKRF